MSSSRREPLFPFPIVDPHHHCWDPYHNREITPLAQLSRVFPIRMRQAAATKVMKIANPALNQFFGGSKTYLWKRYMSEELHSDYDEAGIDVEQTVYIEAGWKGSLADETSFAEKLRLQTKGNVSAGIVAKLDMFAPPLNFEKELRKHQTASKHFRGVRFILCHHNAPKIASFTVKNAMAQNRFRKSLELLSKHSPGATFDLWCYHPQLEEAFDLARAMPQMTFILNHMGTPADIGGENGKAIFSEWKDGIAAFGSLKNTVIKLSGVMPVLGFGFEETSGASRAMLVDKIGPLVSHCIDVFGVDRCMFASNFPVDKACCSMADLYGAYAKMTRHLSLEDRMKLFNSNAKRVYRLT